MELNQPLEMQKNNNIFFEYYEKNSEKFPKHPFFLLRVLRNSAMRGDYKYVKELGTQIRKGISDENDTLHYSLDMMESWAFHFLQKYQESLESNKRNVERAKKFFGEMHLTTIRIKLNLVIEYIMCDQFRNAIEQLFNVEYCLIQITNQNVSGVLKYVIKNWVYLCKRFGQNKINIKYHLERVLQLCTRFDIKISPKEKIEDFYTLIFHSIEVQSNNIALDRYYNKLLISYKENQEYSKEYIITLKFSYFSYLFYNKRYSESLYYAFKAQKNSKFVSATLFTFSINLFFSCLYFQFGQKEKTLYYFNKQCILQAFLNEQPSEIKRVKEIQYKFFKKPLKRSIIYRKLMNYLLFKDTSRNNFKQESEIAKSLALTNYAAKNYKLAIKYSKILMNNKFSSIKHQQISAYILVCSYFELKKFSEIPSALMLIAKIGTKGVSRKKQIYCDIQLHLAEILFILGYYADAICILSECIIQADNHQRLLKRIYIFCRAFMELKKYAECLKCANLIYSLNEKLDSTNEDTVIRCIVENIRSMCIFLLYNINERIPHRNNLIFTDPYYQVQLNFELELCIVYREYRYALSSSKFCSRNNYYLPKFFQLQGFVLSKLGQFRSALESYYQSAHFYLEVNPQHPQLRDVYKNISEIYAQMSQPDLSSNYLEKSKVIPTFSFF